MKVSRRRGVVRIGLDEVEIGLLRTLFDDLADALSAMAGDDPVRRRLFPAGYRDDDVAASEFRELTEAGLLDQRNHRIDQARADLPAAAGEVTLDVEGSLRWLAVLNDLRLAIGTRIGVDAGDGPSAADVDRPARAVYVWLTALQDRVVDAVMG